MSKQPSRSDIVQDVQRSLEAAVRDGLPAQLVFERLRETLANVVAFKVLTVLKLDPKTLRSVRLYSSEPSYPVGGTKQHMRSAWSEAVLDRKSVFVAHDLTALRATFSDSAAIEATGCGSIIAAPIIHNEAVLGTMNLWHRDGYLRRREGVAHGPVCECDCALVRDSNPAS